MKIRKRKLKDKEIELLIADTCSFPDLTYVSKELWKKHKNCYVIENNNDFVGVCGVYYFSDWIKIGPLVVLKKFHNEGHGKKLLAEVLKRNKTKNIFIASSNKAVQKIIRQYGFSKVEKYFDLSRVVRIFLLRHFLDYLNIKLITEFIRKKIVFKRGRYNYYVKMKTPLPL